jgi:hypothetical protein
LRDDFARSLVLLELKDVQDAIGVYGEQVDDLTEARNDLTADDEQRLTEDRRLGLDELFEPGLGRHPARKEPDWLLVHAPQAHFHRHGGPSASRQTVLRRRSVIQPVSSDRTAANGRCRRQMTGRQLRGSSAKLNRSQGGCPTRNCLSAVLVVAAIAFVSRRHGSVVTVATGRCRLSAADIFLIRSS